eukprot:2098811-Pleurochrysis_carterae.AAC.1
MFCVVGLPGARGRGGGPTHELRGRVRPQPVRAHIDARRGVGAAQTRGIRRGPASPPSSVAVGATTGGTAAPRGTPGRRPTRGAPLHTSLHRRLRGR